MSKPDQPKKVPSCPQCGRPREKAFRPFCSGRCRDLDLGKWLDGSYAIPAVDAGYDEDDEVMPTPHPRH
ncbi:MAG: DNA gyrase inhibitor YacG [Geminicoccaceae bacterium]